MTKQSDSIRDRLDDRPFGDWGVEDRMLQYEDALRGVLDLCDSAEDPDSALWCHPEAIRERIAEHLGVTDG